jgi:hypothetical protein
MGEKRTSFKKVLSRKLLGSTHIASLIEFHQDIALYSWIVIIFTHMQMGCEGDIAMTKWGFYHPAHQHSLSLVLGHIIPIVALLYNMEPTK